MLATFCPHEVVDQIQVKEILKQVLHFLELGV